MTERLRHTHTQTHCIEDNSAVFYFKPRISGSKCKSSGGVNSATVLFKVLYTIRLKMFIFPMFVFYVLFV